MSATDWKEQIPPGEAEQLERYAEVLRELQKKRALATSNGGADRGLHAKANGGLAAELVVASDVPDELKVGIFAARALTKYKAYVRYSNGAGKRQHDKMGDVRGIAIKVVGVPGKKLIVGLEDKVTQDFLLIRGGKAPTRTAKEFMALVESVETPALAPLRLMLKLGPIRALQILSGALKTLSVPVMPLNATAYASVAPIRWGKYAAKLSLTPHDEAPPVPPTRTSATALGEELAARLAEGPVVYDLRAHLYADETSTPIEDPTVDWPESIAPPQKVAELILAKQDPTSEAGKKLAAYVEQLSFDPWHAPVEFRPLGEIMRARNAAYRLSTIERKALPEPDGSETFA